MSPEARVQDNVYNSALVHGNCYAKSMKSRKLLVVLSFSLFILFPSAALAYPGASCGSPDECDPGEQCVSGICQTSFDSSLDGTNQGGGTANDSGTGSACPNKDEIYDPTTFTCHKNYNATPTNDSQCPNGGTWNSVTDSCSGGSSTSGGSCDYQDITSGKGMCPAGYSTISSSCCVLGAGEVCCGSNNYNNTTEGIRANTASGMTTGSPGSSIGGQTTGNQPYAFTNSPLAGSSSGGTLQNLFMLALTYINNLFVPLIFAIAFAVFLYFVFKFFILGGASEAREQGSKFVMWAVIGFVIMLSIWGIINLAKNTLGFSTQNQPQYPTFKINGQ